MTTLLIKSLKILSVTLLLVTTSPVQRPVPAATPPCLQDFQPETDLFPDKATFQYAEGVTVEYHKYYKVVRILTPWQDADQGFTSVLVHCGAPPPSGYDPAQIITIPVQRIVTLSTTHLPLLESLDQLEALVGVSDTRLINSQAVTERVQQGSITQVSQGGTLDLEQVLNVDPDLVMAFGSGDRERDVHPQLLAAGLPVVLNAEYMETSPLGRAEWLKFMALFLNQEAEADVIFAEVVQQYDAVKALVSGVDNRPTVMTGAPFGGTWYVPGGQSYAAQFLADAGADYLWLEDPAAGSLTLSPEVVLERAIQADVWLNGKQDWRSRAEMLNEDQRYQDFQAFQTGQLYIPNARLNEFGGNDYWESGLMNPHLILSDLVRILHPERLPDHDLVYYRQVDP